jgi:hypothetical protein
MLGARTYGVASAGFILFALSGGAAENIGKLSLKLEGPSSVQLGEPLTLRFTATNVGTPGFYFKQPWKWASNGMRVVATAPDGQQQETSTALLDIDGKFLCTYFKPLWPGDMFSFEDSVIIGPKPVFVPSSHPPADAVAMMIRPHLDLHPARYKLRWIYEPKLYPDEKRCTAAGLPIWSGRQESSEMELNVLK